MNFHTDKRKEIDLVANESHKAWLSLRTLVFDIMDGKKTLGDAGDELTMFYANMVKLYYLVKENPQSK